MPFLRAFFPILKCNCSMDLNEVRSTLDLVQDVVHGLDDDVGAIDGHVVRAVIGRHGALAPGASNKSTAGS